MNVFTQICIVILLCIALYYIFEAIALIFSNSNLFFAKRAISRINPEDKSAYEGVLQLIDSGHKIPIYSNAYFCISGLGEKYHSKELQGYYFLVFHDGDVALYNNDELAMTSVWKPLMKDLIKKAGYTAEDIKERFEQEMFYRNHGAEGFVKKFNITL